MKARDGGKRVAATVVSGIPTALSKGLKGRVCCSRGAGGGESRPLFLLSATHVGTLFWDLL